MKEDLQLLRIFFFSTFTKLTSKTKRINQNNKKFKTAKF